MSTFSPTVLTSRRSWLAQLFGVQGPDYVTPPMVYLSAGQARALIELESEIALEMARQAGVEIPHHER